MTITNAMLAGEYLLCKRRGHSVLKSYKQHGQALGETVIVWDVCRHCGTHYREQTHTELVEMNVPEEAPCPLA